MLALTGASVPADMDDLLARMTLRIASLGLGGGANEIRSNFDTTYGPERLPKVLARCASPGAAEVIARFAGGEANINNAGLKGVGRMSGLAFPRLGGVLQPDAPPQAGEVLRAAVERTLHAGYLLALTVEKNLERPITIEDPDTLWSRLVPLAFEPGPNLHEYVYGLAVVSEFWDKILSGLAMPKQAKALRRPSKIASTISGLAIPGAMLAYVERGDGAPRNSGS